jgi:hypothetical protein
VSQEFHETIIIWRIKEYPVNSRRRDGLDVALNKNSAENNRSLPYFGWAGDTTLDDLPKIMQVFNESGGGGTSRRKYFLSIFWR